MSDAKSKAWTWELVLTEESRSSKDSKDEKGLETNRTSLQIFCRHPEKKTISLTLLTFPKDQTISSLMHVLYNQSNLDTLLKTINARLADTSTTITKEKLKENIRRIITSKFADPNSLQLESSNNRANRIALDELKSTRGAPDDLAIRQDVYENHPTLAVSIILKTPRGSGYAPEYNTVTLQYYLVNKESGQYYSLQEFRSLPPDLTSEDSSGDKTEKQEQKERSKYYSEQEQTRYLALIEKLTSMLNQHLLETNITIPTSDILTRIEFAFLTQAGFLTYAANKIAELKKVKTSIATNLELADFYKATAEYISASDMLQSQQYYLLAQQTYNTTLQMIDQALARAEESKQNRERLLQQKQELLFALAETTYATEDIHHWHLQILKAYTFGLQHKPPGWKGTELQLRQQLINRNTRIQTVWPQIKEYKVGRMSTPQQQLTAGLLDYSIAYQKFILGENYQDYLPYIIAAKRNLTAMQTEAKMAEKKAEITARLDSLEFLLAQQIEEVTSKISKLGEEANKIPLSSPDLFLQNIASVTSSSVQLLRLKEAKGVYATAKIRQELIESLAKFIAELDSAMAKKASESKVVAEHKSAHPFIAFTVNAPNLPQLKVQMLEELGDLYVEEDEPKRAQDSYQQAIVTIFEHTGTIANGKSLIDRLQLKIKQAEANIKRVLRQS